MPDISKFRDLSGNLYNIKDAVLREELSNVDAKKANKSIVAPVEPTTTASVNYEVGSHLIQSEVLYEVIAPIASGETIEPGTNVEVTTIMGISEELISGLGDLGRLKCVSVWGSGDGWTRNITLASGTVQSGLVITWGTVASKDSMFLFSKTTTTNLHLKTILAPSQSGLSVTADSSNSTIVVANGNYGMGIAVVMFYGNLPTISLQE